MGRRKIEADDMWSKNAPRFAEAIAIAEDAARKDNIEFYMVAFTRANRPDRSMDAMAVVCGSEPMLEVFVRMVLDRDQSMPVSKRVVRP